MGDRDDHFAIVLRRECEADEPAMRDMFLAIRRGPLDSAGFDAGTVERLVGHQFELQRAGYRLSRPDAVFEAIVLDGVVVGRLITHDDGERVVLVDVMIDPAHQGRGIGSGVLADVITRASSRPLELRLGHGSPAEGWCRRHGFEHVGADDLQIHLVRVPRDLALAPTTV